MGRMRLSEHIDAPVDHVWEIVVSCERFPEWNAGVVEMKDCPGRLDHVGARATGVARILGRRIESSQETIKADKPNTFALKVSGAGGLKATGTYTFAEARGGTDLTLEGDFDLPLGLFAGVAEKFLSGTVERNGRHSMENLKALCESTIPAHV
jgi:carbon monoxide dehydrogenase subunit G